MHARVFVPRTHRSGIHFVRIVAAKRGIYRRSGGALELKQVRRLPKSSAIGRITAGPAHKPAVIPTIHDHKFDLRPQLRKVFMPKHLPIHLALSLLLVMVTTPIRAVAENFQPYLPQADSFEADYVVVAPDPAYDEFGQKIQAAMHAHADWLRDYSAQHAGKKPLPYHPNFGVTEQQYLRYQASPMNHFLEVSRQTIRIQKKVNDTSIRLTLLGQQLLFNTLAIDSTAPSVTTARDTLPLRAKIEPGPATMPPGAHEGIAFMSRTATVVASKFSEGVLVGKLTGTASGIIRYSLNTPGKVAYAYVTYSIK